jgi:anthranilate phosphoribosyltransferase
VLINAAAAIYVGGRADDLEEALERARAALADGAALGALEALRDASRRVSGSGPGG